MLDEELESKNLKTHQQQQQQHLNTLELLWSMLPQMMSLVKLFSWKCLSEECVFVNPQIPQLCLGLDVKCNLY